MSLSCYSKPMCLAFKAEQTVGKSAVTKQGAFNCAFGMVKKGVIGTVAYNQHAGHSTEFLQQYMANQAFVGECTLAVTCDVQTDADPRD